jgi:hypothetical protein
MGSFSTPTAASLSKMNVESTKDMFHVVLLLDLKKPKDIFAWQPSPDGCPLRIRN